MTRILHLSDLHLTTKFPTQFSGTKARFCSLVDKIVEKNLIPDIIVISGDIVHHGDTSAFKEFENLIDYALNRFKLERADVIITVGNHDSDYGRTAYLRNIKLDSDGKCAMRNDFCFEKMKNGTPALLPFEEYLRFYRRFYKIPDSVNDANLLTYYRKVKGINFMVINSCWGERSYDSTGTVCIACQQIGYLLNEYLSNKTNDINVTVSHHPYAKICENCIIYYNKYESALQNLYYHTDLALCGHVHSFYTTKSAAGQGAHECVVGNGIIGENTTFALYCIDSFGRYMEIYTLKLNNRNWNIELLPERLELRPKEHVRFNDSRLNQRFCVKYKKYLGENKQDSISVGYFFIKLYSIVLGADYNYSYSKDNLCFWVEDAYIEQAIKQVLHDCYGGIIGSVSKSDRSQFINYFKKWNWLCIDNSGNMRITIEGISLYNNLTKGAK
jgi:calcineurin-like phosphoesterase